MALFRQSCTYMLFLIVTVIHVHAQMPDCYVSNDNPQVEENNPPGHVVTTIEKGPDITITIDPATEHPDFFEINGAQLILKHSLDYETTSAIYVRLKCWDSGVEVNTVDITVSVINLNDNPPVFKEANITVNVNEDIKVNTIVVPQANVTATDADFDTVFYNLTGDPLEATDYFNIQGVNNPGIYLRKALDYEKMNFMQLTLYAMDRNAGALSVHTATATITIHIVQADLRPPWFQPCISIADSKVCISRGYTGRVNISEMVAGPLILMPGPVYAVDGDISLNEKTEYRIVDGNDHDTFSINRDTGNITMNKPVNTIRTFMLYIMASQANNPLRFSQTTVEIQVVRRNDHKPNFEKAAYLGTVSVNLPISSLVMDAGIPSRPLRIFAADEDFPDKVNPDITYQIQNSTDFTVGQDGFLLTTVVLNSASTITLLAIANDTTTLDEASTLIIIDVTPLASTTTVPTTTATTAAPSTPETKTTVGNPSGSSLTPGINNTLSTTHSGSSAIPPGGTTRNAGFTGRPVTNTSSGSNIPPLVTTIQPPVITANASQSQTTRTPVTGISQASSTSHADITGRLTTASGSNILPLVTTIQPPVFTANVSQSQTTRTPVTGISQASSTSHAGITGRLTTASGSNIPPLVTTIQPPIITANASQSQTTRTPVTGISQASSTSHAGITGRLTTASGSNIPPLVTTIQPPIITANASQSQTTRTPVTGISQASSTSHAGITGRLTTASGSNIPPLVTTIQPPIITVNASQSQTTGTPVTGISQASSTSHAGITGRLTTASGSNIPPLVTTIQPPIITANASQSQTTRTPVTGISQASSTSHAGITGRLTTASGSNIPPLVTTIQPPIITANASQSQTTRTPVTGISQASSTSHTGITGRLTTASGSNIPPLVTTIQPPIITANASQSQTARTPVTGISQASSTSHAGITGRLTTASGSNIPPLVTTIQPPIITANASQSQTTGTPVTGISQASSTSHAGITGRLTTASGSIIPPLVTTIQPPIITANASQSQTTGTPVTEISQASSTSHAGITGRLTTASGSNIPPLVTTIKPPIITANASQSQTTGTPVTGTSQASRTSSASITGRETSTARHISSATTVSSASTQISTSNRSTGSVSSPASPTVDTTAEQKDMIILGATLGSLLAITLVVFGLIGCKYYMKKKKQKNEEDSEQLSLGSTNHSFQDDEKPDNKSLVSDVSENNDPITKVQSGTPPPLQKAMGSSKASSGSEGIGEDDGSEKEVKSILTKDRRLADDGYKAVWFKEDANPEAKDDVVMIEADRDAGPNRNDSDSDDGDDEGEDDDSGRGGSQVSFVPGVLSGDDSNEHVFHTVC